MESDSNIQNSIPIQQIGTDGKTQNIVVFNNEPKKSKLPFLIFGIVVFLVIISILGYKYFSSSIQSKTKSTKVKISPTVTLVPTVTIAIPTQIPSATIAPIAKPTIAVKKQVLVPTATKAPTATPTPSDNQAPVSYFASGSGTYSRNSEGKVCLGFSPPSDNKYSAYDIESRYRFDGGDWSHYAKVLGTACQSLSPGQHTVEVQSKDPAGNEENPPKSISITVE